MSLINRGAKASKWAALSMIVLTIVQFVQLIILSRLLQPSDFGLMGMTMVIISFSQAFVDMGVSNALISHKEISSNQRQSLYWFNIFTGFFIFIIIFSSATLISSFYNEPQLIQLIRLMSLIFLIIPIGQQIQILLQKELNFKLIAYIEITSAMLGFLMSFMTAYNGFGVFSLAVGQIVNFFIKSLLLLLVGMRKWPIQLHFSLSEIRRYINFGLFQIGERSVHFLSYNLDYIIIGRFLGAEALGFYTFAYQLIVLPILKINPVITQVAFPLLAKVQYDTIRLKIGYLKVIKYLSYINYPIYFGLFITGPMIVPLLFGEKWSDSIVLIQILCAMGLLRSSISPVNTLLLSKGRADLGFKWSLISMALLIPAISLGAYLNGVVGICISYVILQFILLLLNYFLLIKKILGQCLIQYAFSMLPAFLFSSVMLITLWIILNYIKLGIMWLEFSIQIIIGIIVYLSQIYFFKYHVFKEMLHLIISKQKIDKDEGATFEFLKECKLMKITVIGTGYVGLVSGVCFAETGNHVTCVDKVSGKIDMLNEGIVPIYEPGLEELMMKNMVRGNLNFTTNITKAIKDAELIIIAVGTPSLTNGEADLSSVEEVARQIGVELNSYKIIVTKSTVPVGTNDIIKSIINELTTIPFDVASVPEFLREGSAVQDTLNPDRVVIGSQCEHVHDILISLHTPLTNNFLITDIRSAEMIKYASNAFLATKISFINEIANICEKVGADVQEVAKGMGLDKRIGSSFLRAGIGYGGSCFPKDTNALVQLAGNVDYDFKLLKSVIEVNQNQRFSIISKLKSSLIDLNGKTIGIWGLSFKPNTDDIRYSPAIEIIEEIIKAGANVRVYDPIALNNFRNFFNNGNIEWCDSAIKASQNCHALCLLTEWEEFKNIDLFAVEKSMHTPILIDGRNVYSYEEINNTNFIYFSIGRPNKKSERYVSA